MSMSKKWLAISIVGGLGVTAVIILIIETIVRLNNG